jgi:hypothetical protein
VSKEAKATIKMTMMMTMRKHCSHSDPKGSQLRNFSSSISIYLMQGQQQEAKRKRELEKKYGSLRKVWS